MLSAKSLALKPCCTFSLGEVENEGFQYSGGVKLPQLCVKGKVYAGLARADAPWALRSRFALTTNCHVSILEGAALLVSDVGRQ